MVHIILKYNKRLVLFPDKFRAGDLPDVSGKLFKMQVVVNNISRKDELEFKERVKQLMIKQIKKKFFGAEGSNSIKPSCDAPFIVHNNTQQ